MHVKKGSFVKNKSGASEIDMSNDKGTPPWLFRVYPIGSVYIPIHVPYIYVKCR